VGNNTKNQDTTVYPVLQIQFNIFVQITINIVENTKFSMLILLYREAIIPVIAIIK
jgi:hypothetical protein